MLFKQTTPWQQTEPPGALAVKSSPFEFAKTTLVYCSCLTSTSITLCEQFSWDSSIRYFLYEASISALPPTYLNKSVTADFLIGDEVFMNVALHCISPNNAQLSWRKLV